MPLNPRWPDLIVGIAVLLLAIVMGWQVTVIPVAATYAQVPPTLFPWLVVGLLGLLGAGLLVQALRGGWSHEIEDEAGHGGHYDRLSLAWLLAGLALNAAIIQFGGFILASTLLFICVARAFGSGRWLRNGAIGFLLAAVAYVGFDRVLGYRIGSGLIESLL